LVLGALACAALGTAGYEWSRRAPVASAAVVENGAAASSGSGVRAEGRVVTYPGGDVTVGVDVDGTLKSLRVVENQVVKKGDLLAEIRADEEQAALAESRARIKEADVDIGYFTREKDRTARLFGEKVLPDGEMDKSTHALDMARAEAVVAEATATHLGATLAKRRIVAPIDGTIVSRVADAGETVKAGSTLVTIADLSHLRIEAEVDEYDAARAVVGALVTVTAEGAPDTEWRGHVEEVPRTVAARRLKPEDPARPSDTRVVLAKIALEEPTPLLLGQRVQVVIKRAAAR
jgi:RND family efflux transporter MFP subunit